METDRIARLEAEVAVLHSFVVSLIDALPEEISKPLRFEFPSRCEMHLASLHSQMLDKEAKLFTDAVEALNDRQDFPPSQPAP